MLEYNQSGSRIDNIPGIPIVRYIMLYVMIKINTLTKIPINVGIFSKTFSKSRKGSLKFLKNANTENYRKIAYNYYESYQHSEKETLYTAFYIVVRKLTSHPKMKINKPQNISMK